MSWSWKTAGFRLNQYLSNWASHVSGLGPSFIKIWACGSSPRSGSRNVWTRIKKGQWCNCMRKFWYSLGTIQMISCRARLVTMDETQLYHYDPEKKQQSIQWRHSGSSRPKKIPSAKIRWKSSRLDFFGIKTASSSFIIFQRAKLSTRIITYLCWCK